MTSSRRKAVDTVAGNDQLPASSRYELHRLYAVPVAAVELNDNVLAWVRRVFSGDAAEPKEGYQGTIYPVVATSHGLVLVAGLNSFAAIREAGAAWVTVYILKVADERELLELIVAFAAGDLPSASTAPTDIDANRRGRRP